MSDSEANLELDLDATYDSAVFYWTGATERQLKWLANKLQFEKAKDNGTIGDLLMKVERVNELLKSLEVFGNIETHIDMGETSRDVEVIYVVTPKKMGSSISTYVNNAGQVSVEFEANVPAVFRGFESLRLTFKTLPMIGNESAASITLPRLPKFENWFGNLNFIIGSRDNSPFASSTEKFSSAHFTVMENTMKHSFTWEYRLNQLNPFLDAHRVSSKSLLQEQLSSIKHSLKYSYNNICSPDDPIQNNTQASLELPLLGGNYLIKGEFFASLNRVLRKNLSLQYNFFAGGIFPIFGNTSTYFDRFSSTGPSGSKFLMKGFKSRGFGPFDTYYTKNSNSIWQAKRDDLGGDVYISSQFNLFYNLEFLKKHFNSIEPQLMLFTHLGSLGKRLNRNTLSELYSGLKLSVGFGLSIPLPFGQAEFTIAQPFYSTPHDVTERFQFGLKMNFNF